MGREYEIMVILQTGLIEEEREKLIGQVEEWITSSGGQLVTTDRMGTRRLAYKINGQRDGFYVRYHLQGEGELAKQIERKLKVTDQVLKYLSIRIDLETKKIEKLRKIRENREARRKSKARAPTRVEPRARATTKVEPRARATTKVEPRARATTKVEPK